MSTRGNRWITGALLVAIGAWSAPMTTLAATTALRAPASQTAGAKTDSKHKKKDPYKKAMLSAPKPKEKKKDEKALALDTKKPKHKDQDKKPPQTLAAKEPKKDSKNKKKDGQLFA